MMQESGKKKGQFSSFRFNAASGNAMMQVVQQDSFMGSYTRFNAASGNAMMQEDSESIYFVSAVVGFNAASGNAMMQERLIIDKIEEKGWFQCRKRQCYDASYTIYYCLYVDLEGGFQCRKRQCYDASPAEDRDAVRVVVFQCRKRQCYDAS